MPLTLKFNHPNHGGEVTISNITKLEGVFFVPSTTPTHYALYVGNNPYEHSRLNYLVPKRNVHTLKVTDEREELEDTPPKEEPDMDNYSGPRGTEAADEARHHMEQARRLK